MFASLTLPMLCYNPPTSQNPNPRWQFCAKLSHLHGEERKGKSFIGKSKFLFSFFPLRFSAGNSCSTAKNALLLLWPLKDEEIGTGSEEESRQFPTQERKRNAFSSKHCNSWNAEGGLTLKCSNFPLILSFFLFSAAAHGKEGRIKRRRKNREIKARLFLFPASASLAFVRNESKDRKKKERLFPLS